MKRKISQKSIERICKLMPDMKAFVRWSIANGREKDIVCNLLHDVLGIVGELNCFMPRTSGFAHTSKGKKLPATEMGVAL